MANRLPKLSTELIDSVETMIEDEVHICTRLNNLLGGTILNYSCMLVEFGISQSKVKTLG